MARRITIKLENEVYVLQDEIEEIDKEISAQLKQSRDIVKKLPNDEFKILILKILHLIAQLRLKEELTASQSLRLGEILAKEFDSLLT